MACFVARHLKPERWNEASSQCYKVYCLGKCYIAPSAGFEDERPRVEVHSRSPIVLERIAQGGARSLDSYTSDEGYKALERALARSPEEIVRELELSGLRGRSGAGFSSGKKWRAVLNERSASLIIVSGPSLIVLRER